MLVRDVIPPLPPRQVLKKGFRSDEGGVYLIVKNGAVSCAIGKENGCRGSGYREGQREFSW